MRESGRESMADAAPSRRFARLLLLATLLHLAVFAFNFGQVFLHRNGIMAAPEIPFGGDFVNLWTSAKLVLSGASDRIYLFERFMEFQHGFVADDIGVRLWAYPPHSLLFVAPFGLAGFYAGFTAWTLLGLAVLAAGARRIGLDRFETAILVFSPASLQCVSYGQTGNIACGLMLLALAGRSPRDRSSIVAAALLTMKPQAGFLLPLAWLMRRRWPLLIATSAATLALVALSVLVFGVEAWKDYIGDTLPALSRLEREGVGNFLSMMPSLFISLRQLGAAGNAAPAAHFVLAGAVAGLLIWRLSATRDSARQAALVLIATCLITPYLHMYDLGLLLAGALLILRDADAAPGARHALAAVAASLAWILPNLVMPMGRAGLPLSPAIMAVVFLAACLPAGRAGARPTTPGRQAPG